MLIYDATPDQIQTASAIVGAIPKFSAPKGRAQSVRFFRDRDALPEGVKMRAGSEGRRMPTALCWHGFRDLFREIFALAPNARVKTALADYRGGTDFERQYLLTFGKAGDCFCRSEDPR